MTREAVPSGELTFRKGRQADLDEAGRIAELALTVTRDRLGVTAATQHGAGAPGERPLLEALSHQVECEFWIAEEGDGAIGFALSVRMGGVDELSQLMVLPEAQGRGVGRALLERCWPADMTVPRLVVAAGAPADLSLYLGSGLFPAAGHWHLRAPTSRYLQLRSHDVDEAESNVHVLGRDHARAEWARLEPAALGHAREPLHDHFSRTSTCLALMDPGSGRAAAVCWVSPAGEIGPAVGGSPGALVPVVTAALDRVAKERRLESLGAFCVSTSTPLLRALVRLGFRVHWPSWIMSSDPLPAIERYVPTRPPLVL